MRAPLTLNAFFWHFVTKFSEQTSIWLWKGWSVISPKLGAQQVTRFFCTGSQRVAALVSQSETRTQRNLIVRWAGLSTDSWKNNVRSISWHEIPTLSRYWWCVIKWLQRWIMKSSPDCSSPSCQGLAHRDPRCNFQPSLKCETRFNNPHNSSKTHILALADLHQCKGISVICIHPEIALLAGGSMAWPTHYIVRISHSIVQYWIHPDITLLTGRGSMAGTILSDVNFSIVCCSYRCHQAHHQPYPSLLRKSCWVT